MLRNAITTFLAAEALHTSRLLVAVSGGVDSLALLHACVALLPAQQIVVAHFDHQLRPDSADDRRFVLQTAADWGVAAVSDSAPVAQLAQADGHSLEEAARLARYRFLAQAARARAIGFVVTAHHLDDQAETVLLHVLRGSGLQGLQGMRPRAPLPTASELTLLRPLLAVTGAQLRQYCRDHDLQPREDPSNRDVSLTRNRLRLQLMPQLAALQPNLNRRLATMADLIAADAELLTSLTEEALVQLTIAAGAGYLALDRAQWLALPPALQRRTLRAAVLKLAPAVEVGAGTVENGRRVAQAGAIGAEAQLPGGVRLIIDYERLTLSLAGALPPLAGPQLTTATPQRLPVPGRLALADGWELVAERVTEPPMEETALQVTLSLPPGPLWLRPRQPGERIQPLGMQGRSRKIKDVMIDRKLARRLRARWPLLATDAHVVWIVGHVVDRRARRAGEADFVRLSCRRRA